MKLVVCQLNRYNKRHDFNSGSDHLADQRKPVSDVTAAHDTQNLQPAESVLSATRRVTDDLRQRIISGELSPGSRLKIESLKSLLGVGASPIRRACGNRLGE